MSVPATYFENRQSCWKHPNNRFFLRGQLWFPGMPENSSWVLYVGPFRTASEAASTSFLLHHWAYSSGYQWTPGGKQGTAQKIVCVWGPDSANGMPWGGDKLSYVWTWEPEGPLYIVRRAKYRAYAGLPGKYTYHWEGQNSQQYAAYQTDGLPGWAGV